VGVLKSLAMSIATEALTGFASSAAYDAHRPTYPPKALAELLTHLDVAGAKGAKVMDLAAGTGKFTELLSAREEGYEVLAVEPHEGMREQLSKKNLKGVRILHGTAESMSEVGTGEVAAVVASQVRWLAAKSRPNQY
jgi:ubiquinone/menaquinone biosynthesis C-methylase UbiE